MSAFLRKDANTPMFTNDREMKTFRQVAHSRKVPPLKKRSDYNTNYSPDCLTKRTDKIKTLDRVANPEFKGWVGFKVVPEAEAVGSEKRYRILRWVSTPEWSRYRFVGGQWTECEIEIIRTLYKTSDDKRQFARELEKLLDDLAGLNLVQEVAA